MDGNKHQQKPKSATQTSNKIGMPQDRFDKMVTKYIINGIQPLRAVEDDSFKELMFGNYITMFIIMK